MNFAGQMYHKLYEQRQIEAAGGNLAIDKNGVVRWCLPEDIYADSVVLSNKPAPPRYIKNGVEIPPPLTV